jgi:peptidoglycan/xylan/chitin deacetylase (PgdA/CDA1 family)
VIVGGQDHPERDLIGYGRSAPKVEWPDGARVAVTIQVNYEEGAEYTAAVDGRNEEVGEFVLAMDGSVADLATQSAFEYGSRAGIWRVARLLDEYRIPWTLNACAVALERNPEVAGYVKESGQEVCCHGWRWEELWTLERADEEERLRRAVASIEKTCGQRPLGWASRLMPSAHTRELLVEAGFLYDSDAINDDLPYFVDVGGRPHLVVPLTFTYNDGRFILGGADDPVSFANYCTMGFDELWREGATHPKLMTVSLHPRWIGQAARAGALRAFLEHALARADVWFARRLDVARWWIDRHASFTR